MCEAEQARVQGLTWKGGDPGTTFAAARDSASRARPVKRIADQRMPAMGKMHSDLMRSPCREAALDKSRLRPEGSLDNITRDRRFSFALPDDGHLLAICTAATDVPYDLARKRRRQAPDDCGIGSFDPAKGKIVRQCVMGGLCLGDDHEPAGALVETMNDTGSTNPTDPGEARAAVAD